MRRELFTEDHDLFRDQVRRFVREEVEPHLATWNAAGVVPRSAWKRLGDAGYLGADLPEEYGGSESGFLFDAIIMEELTYARAHALQMWLHTDVCLPYLATFGTPEQKERFLRPGIAGDCLVAIAMTEPGTGSDLASIQTKAIRDGDELILDGAKTFISNGQNCDLVIVAAKTDPSKRHDGLSLILVEADTDGFERGRNLEKIGLKGQDTSELFFQGCRVPAANLLGQEGRGFKMLMQMLQQERLCVALQSMASIRRSLDDTLAYVKERNAFGQSIGSFQNSQFILAELATEMEIGQVFVDRLLEAHARGEDVVSEVSMAKWWCSDLQKKTAARCLQLHGGYGIMADYPIAHDLGDAAVQSIYAGTNEIMKVIIAKRLGLN